LGILNFVEVHKGIQWVRFINFELPRGNWAWAYSTGLQQSSVDEFFLKYLRPAPL